MSRLLATMRTDVTVQVRNKLYAIGLGVAALLGFTLSRIVAPDALGRAIPPLMLGMIGGSTLLYVAGMILFEKDEGTLSALIVSPLTVSEYLTSKIITLTVLATLESIVITIGGAALMGRDVLADFNAGMLLLGIVAIGVIYTLMGIVLVVRYRSITDFLVPVVAVATLLQAPAFHFAGLAVSYAWYIIPTTAPTLLIAGAWHPLAAWEWAYALTYTALTIGVLYVWSVRSFQTHIVMRIS